MDLELNDIVRLKKKHPCGGSEWRVLRTGADIRIRCTTCQRVVMLPRAELERRIVALVSREDAGG
ncbi:MAG: DUF951 domain-containing protein [Dehalococcoidia bacterium]